jgi:hypothetical protein
MRLGRQEGLGKVEKTFTSVSQFSGDLHHAKQILYYHDQYCWHRDATFWADINQPMAKISCVATTACHIS